jgi:hypothetical protein
VKLALGKIGIHRILLFAFWYLACFPGKLGYDYALLTRMVQSGESTAWWGASYFWIFKIFTFSGLQIYVLSLLGLSLLTYSLYLFIQSLPTTDKIRGRALTAIMATPLYGVFGVTISHDVFQASGILIISSILISVNCQSDENRIEESSRASVLLSAFCLLTTQTGIVIVALFCIYLFVKNSKKFAVVVLALSIGVYFFSNAGISTGQTSVSFVQSTLPRLMLIDLKCIVQHPEVKVSQDQWIVLEKYSTKANWLKQVSCSNPDILAAPLELGSLFNPQVLNVDSQLTKVFFSLVSQSPAIPVVSHIQRSRVALPPPFFQPPSNQIPWDVNIPLGVDTNVALQSGPGLLHTSIDEKSVEISVPLFKPLEVIAQSLTLLINQASWFWSWGGMWLWPITFFVLTRINKRNLLHLSIALLPTISLHLSLFLIGPSSLGRYVMSTILQGVIICLILISEKLERKT